MLGDNAYPDGTDAEYQTAVFDICPRAAAHSRALADAGQPRRPQRRLADPDRPYFDIFTLPTAGEAGGVASGTEAYYSFDYGNIHFVVLDSHDTSIDPRPAR